MKAKKTIEKKDEKPLFKMRMFSDVGSRVVDGIKNFKTYDNKNNKKIINENCNENEQDNDAQIDNMIEKIENELKELQTNPNDNININNDV